MEYSQQSNCLVAMRNFAVPPGHSPWYSAVTALDLAAGGRMLCRSTASVCALPPTAKRCSVLRSVRMLSADANQLSVDSHHIIEWALMVIVI